MPSLAESLVAGPLSREAFRAGEGRFCKVFRWAMREEFAVFR